MDEQDYVDLQTLLAKLNASISAEAPKVPATIDDFIKETTCVIHESVTINTNFIIPLCPLSLFIILHLR